MGDLIHALPALTDAAKAIPGITFDWVIDKNFNEVAQWHPAVKNIITTQHRQWRKHPWQAMKNGEINQFLKTIRQDNYDLVIDGQNNFKSAFITLLTKRPTHGLDKNSAREFVAHFAYQHKYEIAKDLHAITKLRLLFAKIFNYTFANNLMDYGISTYPFPELPFKLPTSYVYLVHNASWQSKLWPESYWHQLIKLAANEGLQVVLPWGNRDEQERAERLSHGNSNAIVLPFCTLSQHARILLDSKGAICSDTGLSHLAAALNVPAVTMYGPTNPDLIGTTGPNQQHAIASFPCKSCCRVACHYSGKKQSNSRCLESISPTDLWNSFKSLK